MSDCDKASKPMRGHADGTPDGSGATPLCHDGNHRAAARRLCGPASSQSEIRKHEPTELTWVMFLDLRLTHRAKRGAAAMLYP
jgi:hypothetical protein